MKRLLLLVSMIGLFTIQGFAVNSENWKTEINKNPELKDLSTFASQLTLEEFLNLTPKKIREYTGERMGIKNIVALKAAQKMIKRGKKKRTDISRGLYIFLAIIGFGFYAIGFLTDFEGGDWVTCLLLTALCGLPGIIYAFVKMDDYY